MEKQAAQNIQDAFLNSSRRERVPVSVTMLDGTVLAGRIKSFDRFSVLIELSSTDVLLFKHAIASISLDKKRSA